MDTNKSGNFTSQSTNALAKRTDSLVLPVTPIADIYETADGFTMKLDMPGASKESIRVTVEPGQLEIQSMLAERHGDEGALLFSEIGRKRYRRVFNLGRGVDHQNMQAQFEDGVLTVVIPKTEAGKVREIQIR